jgi:RHS repeat-associated protein
VKKLAGGFTTYYIWEGAQVIAEYSNAPAGTGGTSYYFADRLSTRMVTDGSGLIKGTQDHLPFGEEGGTSGTSEKHRFTNYERDSESGTDYAVHRQYSAATGRFIRPDPIGGVISTPQSHNTYAYVQGSPLDLIDPPRFRRIFSR